MDINNHHERLLAELVESYARLSTELQRFEGIGDTIIRFSISNPHPNDETLNYTHRVKSEYLETELKNKTNILAAMCQPYKVCVGVHGYKRRSCDGKSEIMTIGVKYESNVAYKYHFVDGKLDQTCRGNYETFYDDINSVREMHWARDLFTIMTPEELATHGFIIGKPILNKQIK